MDVVFRIRFVVAQPRSHTFRSNFCVNLKLILLNIILCLTDGSRESPLSNN